MQENVRGKPVVLVLAGHDPTGGAGIQADIEAIGANGCHAATVITCLTTQNTAAFKKYIPVSPEDFLQQTELILAETPISACKIGLLADPGILSAIEKILLHFGKTPVVFDPVISAGSGEKIMTDDIIMYLRDKILPFITVLTPNTIEARALSGMDDLPAAVQNLLRHGCRSVLVTGTHEPTDKVINTLYLEQQKPVKFVWDRLDGTYHGSGCTLSAAIASNLAQGKDIKVSVTAAQQYTWNALKHGLRLGGKQYLPDRFYRE